MIRHLRLPCAAACAAAAAVALATVQAAPAQAAAGRAQAAATTQIVIDSVSSPLAESGLLSIQAEATSPITSLSATVDAPAPLSIPASDFALTSGSAQDGIWTVTSPITQAELALGTYQVTVDATDSGGDTFSGTAPGSFFFGLDPTVTLSASITMLSFFQQVTTFSGMVSAAYPDGTVQPPPAGSTVHIEGQYGDNYSATTDATGAYTVMVAPPVESRPGQAESFTANVAASATTQPAGSAAVQLTGQVYPVQVTVKLSTSTAKFGAPVTLSGTAQYQSGGIWLKFADSAIDITGTDLASNDTIGPRTATTDDSGNFSLVLPARPTTTWTADPPASGYLSTTSQPGSTLPNSALLTVVLPTAAKSLRLTYNPAGQLTTTGCLGLAPAVTSFPSLSPPAATALTLQYASSARGPWRTVGSLAAGGPACSHGTGFRSVFRSPPLSAYFRVRFGGQLLYQPAVSAVVHAATAVTRFRRFNVRPRSVSRTGKITVSGELQRKTAHGWTGLRGTIAINLKPAGSSGWYYLRKLHVGKSGKFKITFADPVSAHWAVSYAGDATHLASQSKIIYVTKAGG